MIEFGKTGFLFASVVGFGVAIGSAHGMTYGGAFIGVAMFVSAWLSKRANG